MIFSILGVILTAGVVTTSTIDYKRIETRNASISNTISSVIIESKQPKEGNLEIKLKCSDEKNISLLLVKLQ